MTGPVRSAFSVLQKERQDLQSISSFAFAPWQSAEDHHDMPLHHLKPAKLKVAEPKSLRPNNSTLLSAGVVSDACI